MRLKLLIAYDGRPFRGWQSQAGGGTVQDHLESALAALCGKRIPVHGSGRTDTGVHALAQCAHADVERPRFKPSGWIPALNAHLPREIRVMKCVRVPAGFHARFSARGKVYTYRIWNHPVHPPLELGRSWHLPGMLDLRALQAGAEPLTGTHDFAAFAANRGTPARDTVRTIHAIKIRKRGPLITLRFEGDGFLYKMVRLITGTLVRCGQHRSEPDWIVNLLAGKTKTSFAAPAEGLYLTRVVY
jgi:tRNA pseudouridine38-40 synthase